MFLEECRYNIEEEKVKVYFDNIEISSDSDRENSDEESSDEENFHEKNLKNTQDIIEKKKQRKAFKKDS